MSDQKSETSSAEPTGVLPGERAKSLGVRGRKQFRDMPIEEFHRPDLNPYLKMYRSYGPPVILGEEAPSFKGRWNEAFGRKAPLFVEVGPGNGFFLAGMAKRHPEYNWCGIEIRFKRVILCARKIEKAGVSNARITRYDAWWLDDLFEPGEVAGIRVNFPDPWKKERDEKHRLMSRPFAEWAARVLQVGGTLRLKSDHRPNLDRLIDSCAGLSLTVADRTDDVAAVGTPWSQEDDVVTNYQTKFDKLGLPVYALEMVQGADGS